VDPLLAGPSYLFTADCSVQRGCPA
jgi:hypothetical protein